jgi:3-keto-5-aminohexanoate cleavage enzyme
MTTPAIVTVAITGNVTTKNENPAVPVTIAEQVESTQEAFEAGATVAHVHVRNDEGKPCSDPDRFAKLQEGLNKHCPGMIVQFSTGARGGKGTERSASMIHRPEMASLSTGSVNLGKVIYENPAELADVISAEIKKYGVRPEVEVFDLAHLYNAAELIKRDLVPADAHVQFVMGIPGALPAKESVFKFLLAELKEIIPAATWTATGTGRYSFMCNEWSLANGGHVRTGLEDNVMIDKGVLAASNAALVEKTISFMPKYNRHPASVAEARSILKLPEYKAQASKVA